MNKRLPVELGVNCHVAASTLCSNLNALVSLSVDDMAKLYRDVLTALLDRHCPSVKVRRRAKQNAPWFDAECRTARRRARAAERRFQRSHSDVDRQAWAVRLRLLRTLYEQKNSDFESMLSIMSCCYFDLSNSSACVASCWIGFGPICQAGRSVLCSTAVRRPSSTSSALFRKVQC